MLVCEGFGGRGALWFGATVVHTCTFLVEACPTSGAGGDKAVAVMHTFGGAQACGRIETVRPILRCRGKGKGGDLWTRR